MSKRVTQKSLAKPRAGTLKRVKRLKKPAARKKPNRPRKKAPLDRSSRSVEVAESWRGTTKRRERTLEELSHVQPEDMTEQELANFEGDLDTDQLLAMKMDMSDVEEVFAKDDRKWEADLQREHERIVKMGKKWLAEQPAKRKKP